MERQNFAARESRCNPPGPNPSRRQAIPIVRNRTRLNYFLAKTVLICIIVEQRVQQPEFKCSRAEKVELAVAVVLASVWLWLTVT
jgi:hypothetical protein